jgi:oligopeptide/dipeptide ABC transporter ATP-binding protein
MGTSDPTAASRNTVLAVENLEISFLLQGSVLKAVDGISFSLSKGEVLGIVGESGSGKTVTALSIMGLLPKYARVTGKISLTGTDLIGQSEEKLRRIRGARVAMIYQDPLTALNPVMRVGAQIAEAMVYHLKFHRSMAFQKAVELMKLVKIPNAEKRAMEYPHQFSGGMRQRVVIAMAIACHPDVLIADEPTTMLDLITQDEILEIVRALRGEESSIIYITHDLGVVAEICDRVVIMYAGKVVETADVRTVFKHHLHPYTHGLLKSLPKIHATENRLDVIEGTLPDLIHRPIGCIFHPRCPYAKEICSQEDPPLREFDPPGHKVACVRAEEITYE